jgi:glycine cleavage system H protein
MKIMSNVPENLKYSKSHEWVMIDGDIATVGITDHAQDELGDIVFLELPQVGRMLAFDDIFGTVESVKAVSELFSPVAGEVVEVNESLINSEATINDTPYEGGWMMKVKLKDTSAAQAALLDAAAYKSEIGE